MILQENAHGTQCLPSQEFLGRSFRLTFVWVRYRDDRRHHPCPHRDFSSFACILGYECLRRSLGHHSGSMLAGVTRDRIGRRVRWRCGGALRGHGVEYLIRRLLDGSGDDPPLRFAWHGAREQKNGAAKHQCIPHVVEAIVQAGAFHHPNRYVHDQLHEEHA